MKYSAIGAMAFAMLALIGFAAPDDLEAQPPLDRKNCNPYDDTELCDDFSWPAQIMAQAICTAVKPFPIHPSGARSPGNYCEYELARGWVWAVPRTCSERVDDYTPSCKQICANLTDSTKWDEDGKPTGSQHFTGPLECFNSLHIYTDPPAVEPYRARGNLAHEVQGLRTHIYYHCDGSRWVDKEGIERGWCGANYCCCTGPEGQALQAPVGLQRESSANECKLSWTDTTDNEDGFIVYIGIPVFGNCEEAATGWSEVGRTGPDATQFSWPDSCCDVSENSCAMVRSFNKHGQSEESNIIMLAPVC